MDISSSVVAPPPTIVSLSELVADADPAGVQVAVFVDREPGTQRRRLHIDEFTLWQGGQNAFTMLSEPSGVSPEFRAVLDGSGSAADYIASLKHRHVVAVAVHALMRSADATTLLDRYATPAA
jgi:hypothetical protein